MAAPTVVQSKGAMSNNVVSAAITFDSTPTAGNGIIVVVWDWQASTPTLRTTDCVDNKGNTYVRDCESHSTNNNGGVAIYSCSKIVTTSATFTITVTNDKGSANYFGVSIIEVGCTPGKGMSLDVATAQSAGAGGPFTTGNTASVSSPDLIVASCVQLPGTQASITVEVVSPTWNQILEALNFSTTIPGESDYRILSAASGAQSCSWTPTGSTYWSAAIAGYKVVGGGSPPGKGGQGNKKSGGGGVNLNAPGGTQIYGVGNAGLNIQSN